ncbi:MAG: beta-galactosidase [Armatimonadota bacterium]
MHIRPILITLALIPAVMVSAETIGDEEKRLPISTGNFSVTWIQHSPVGAFPDPNFNGEGVPPADNWAQHRKAGLNAYEDYVAWGAVEREPGKWDWSRQIETAVNQNAGGLEYDPYLWIMNPPAWMREGKLPVNELDAPDHYTVMRCLEHGEPTQTFSIWDPATVKWFERYYRETHKAMGDKIGRIYVGLVGPYGEGNYPLPMFDWLTIGHCHEGYWCGDEYARKDFIDTFKKRYRTLKSLNTAWGSDFARWDDVTFPPEIKDGKILEAEQRTEPKSRRRWVDFIEWYHQSLIDFSVDVTKAAMKYFPAERLKMKPGGSAGGVNPIAWGTYCPGYAKADVPYKVRMQPADCHGRPFADRWYGTAYRFYGIPFSTEPAGSMDNPTFRRRVFMDACNGTTEMFAYEWDKHGPDGRKWIHLYHGVPSITDVAVFCPTTWYRMNGDLWPMIRSVDTLREITDFEVADEIIVADDYLAKSKTRVLLWLGGPVVDRPILAKIVRWVRNGGIMVSNMSVVPTDIEGRNDLGLKLFPQLDASKPQITKLGSGFVLNRVSDDVKSVEFADMVRTAVYHPDKLKRDLEGAPEIDSEFDGVWTAVFPDMMLLYNNNDKPVSVTRLWEGKEVTVSIKPGSLAEIL